MAEAPASVGALYFSTSSRMILPSGPEPLILDRGIPRSNAIFLAMGDANIRSPAGRSPSEWVLGFDVGSDLGGATSGLEGSGAFSFDGSEEGEKAFSDANLSTPARSSDSSARTAMREPTWTFFAPSAA
jgi:hypothetical protein